MRTTLHSLLGEGLAEELVVQVHEGSVSRADLSCVEVVLGGVLISPPACCPHGNAMG